MLFITISGINLSTRVGASDLKANIHSIKLVQFQFNVVDMGDNIMANYKLIVDRGS